METIEAITQRRAVKLYDANHKIPEAEINQLLGLAKLSPTA